MSRSTDDLITDGALALLALKSAPASPPGYPRTWDRTSLDQKIAKISTKGVEIYMRRSVNSDSHNQHQHPQLIVGRRHSPQTTPALSLMANHNMSEEMEPVTVDLELGQNSYVSRQHLKIYYETEEEKFFLRCLGKNGILVDDMLVRRNSDPVELPDKCIMRFPSTQIKLLFEAIMRKTQQERNCSHDNSDLQLTTPASAIIQPANCTVENGINGASVVNNKFFSPCPSPTGTMSAVNSCPASPRTVVGGVGGMDNDSLKPPYSYAQLIVQAISSVSDRQMTLSGIYSFIQKNYPYYRTADRGWQNSIRHNLSLNRYFLKVPRNHDEPGKGSYWRIESQTENKLMEQAFRKRRHRTITAVRSPAFRSAPPSPTHTGTKDLSTNQGQSDGDFDSAPTSPSRSEPGSGSSVSVPSTPSSNTNNSNAFMFSYPAFAQFKPSPTFQGFPGFFLAQAGGMPGNPTGSPTYFLPNMDTYQMPPPNVFKRPSPLSDEEEAAGGNGNPSASKKQKVDSEGDSDGSMETGVQNSDRLNNCSPMVPQN